MTPEQDTMLREVYAWMLERKEQQIQGPLDDISHSLLRAPKYDGDGGSGLTDTISIGPGGGSATVPQAYAGTILLSVEGQQREIPYI